MINNCKIQPFIFIFLVNNSFVYIELSRPYFFGLGVLFWCSKTFTDVSDETTVRRNCPASKKNQKRRRTVQRYHVRRYHVRRYHVRGYHVRRYHVRRYHVRRYHVRRKKIKEKYAGQSGVNISGV